MTRTVLLIDDEEPYVGVIRDVLTYLGMEVVVALNAMEAMDHLHTSRPDLIMLDVMMPFIDGLTLLRWIRNQPEFRSIPVHVVSAKATTDDQKAAMSAGASGFLAKPFRMNDIKKMISEYFPSFPVEAI